MAKNTEIVVYKNELNTIPLRNFNAVEMDLLMALMSQMRDKDVTEVSFDFSTLKELSRYNKETALDSFVGDLKSTYSKLISLNVDFETKSKYVSFVLFTKYEVDKDNQTVKVKVNTEFKDLINKMTGNFTKFELQQFTELRSSYSKTAYRLLKQYRTTGTARFSLDEFRKLLDIPDSYKISDIDKRVLQPIQNELEPIFKGLKITKHKRSRRVVGLEFTFATEAEIAKKQASKATTSKRKKDFVEREYGDGELTKMGEGNWQKKGEDIKVKPDEIDEFCKKNQVDLLENKSNQEI